MKVARSAYYAYRSSQTDLSNGKKAAIAKQVKEVFAEHRRRYGARRLTAELQANLKLVRSLGWNFLTRLKGNRLVNPDKLGLQAVSAKFSSPILFLIIFCCVFICHILLLGDRLE